VGINTAIFSTSGGYQGIGFSIPVNVVKKVLSRLIEGKKIAYAWLGVTVQNLDGDLARRFGVESGKGALVAKILANGPAQKAGLKVGDVILKFEDNKISNIQELIGSVSKTEVGKKVKLELIRDKKHMEVKVSLDERPKNLDEEVLESEPDKEASYSWRGLNVGAITEEVSKYYKLSDSKGVVVVGVKDSSLAEEIGLSKGDIIDSIENREIADLSSFKKITSSIKKDKEVLLHTSKGYFILKGE
jgi:serine protease Do